MDKDKKDIYHKRLSHDIQIIVKHIKNNINEIDAIILCGGYGRGEGGWIQIQSEVYPYNDYDIYIVTQSMLTSDFINKLEKEIANEIGIRWIDIDITTKQKLSTLKETIKNVDLKYGSKVIYGNLNILDVIPDLNPKNIKSLDIEILYFTRLWTFMGSLSNLGFTSLNIDDARFFKNQMAKAVLAIVDALLIMKKSYETSYKNRLTSAIKLYPQKEWLHFLGKWALNEKLNPTSKEMSGDEVKQLYSSVHTIYKEEMCKALSSYYLFKFYSVWSLDINCMLMPYYFSRRIYHYFFKPESNFEKIILIRRIQNYLFFAYCNGNINNFLLKKANRLLKKLDANINAELTWNEARIKIAYIRNEV